MHACEIHAYKVYSHEVHSYEVRAHEVHGYLKYMPLKCMFIDTSRSLSTLSDYLLGKCHGTHPVAVTPAHGPRYPLYIRPEILILVLFFIRTS